MESLLQSPLFQERYFFPTNPDKTPKIPAWKVNAKKAQEALDTWTEPNYGMATGAGLLVIDVDPKNGGNEEAVYSLGFPRGTFKVQTPSGGCHLYYRPEFCDFQTGTNRLGPGIDIRNEGGYVCVPPSSGYSVVCDHEPKIVTSLDVQAALEKVAEKKKVNQEIREHGTNEIVIAEGSRNDSLFREGCYLRNKNVPEIVIRAGLERINSELCNPPLSPRELEIIINQVLKYEPGEEKTSKAKAWSAKELREKFGKAEETFIWEKHIPTRMASMIVARGGLGKSSTVLYVLKQILDSDKDATVLWLPVENNAYDTLIKMEAMGLGESERFWVAGKENGGYGYDFSKQEELDGLEQLVAEIKPKVVVIDSLRSMTSDDLNSKTIGSTMSSVQSIICERAGASLIYIHHTNKKLEGKDVDKIMGSSTIDAQVRVVYSLEQKKENVRVLKPIKNNLLHKPSLLAFVRDSSGIYHEEYTEATDECDEIWDLAQDQGKTLHWIHEQVMEQQGIESQAAWTIVNELKKKHGIGF